MINDTKITDDSTLPLELCLVCLPFIIVEWYHGLQT